MKLLYPSSKMGKNLTIKDFDPMNPKKLLDKSIKLVLFYKPSCIHCKRFIGVRLFPTKQPANCWKIITDTVPHKFLAKINMDKELELSAYMESFGIKGENKLISTFPCIVICKDGYLSETFNKERTVDNLLNLSKSITLPL